MNLGDLKKELAEDQEYINDYKRINDLRLDIALMIDEARIKRGFTQRELAIKMGTKQTAISRAESGDYLPSLSFLERMAKAFKTELLAPRFAFLEEKQGISIDEVAQLGPATFEVAKLLKIHADSSVSAISTSFFEANLQK